jgi:anti-sigma factor RsiW
VRYGERKVSAISTDPPPGAHLSPEQIVAYRDGELESMAARQHVAICPLCQARVARARRLADLIRASLKRRSPPL